MKSFGLSIALLLLLLPSVTAAQERLTIGIPCLNAKLCQMPEVENVLREAYSRVGAAVTFKYLPMLRDLEEANEQLIDGSAFRTKVTLAKYPELIPITTPLAKISFVAFMAKPEITIQSWEDIKGHPVGIMRGDTLGTVMTERLGIQPQAVTSLELGFKMLAAGRFDVFIYERTVGLQQIDALGLQGIHTSEPLFQGYTYHALNVEHKALIPKLAAALREMLLDGTSKRLFGRYQEMIPEIPFDQE